MCCTLLPAGAGSNGGGMHHTDSRASICLAQVGVGTGAVRSRNGASGLTGAHRMSVPRIEVSECVPASPSGARRRATPAVHNYTPVPIYKYLYYSNIICRIYRMKTLLRYITNNGIDLQSNVSGARGPSDCRLRRERAAAAVLPSRRRDQFASQAHSGPEWRRGRDWDVAGRGGVDDGPRLRGLPRAPTAKAQKLPALPAAEDEVQTGEGAQRSEGQPRVAHGARTLFVAARTPGLKPAAHAAASVRWRK